MASMKARWRRVMGPWEGVLLDAALLSVAAAAAYFVRSRVPVANHVILPFRTYLPFFVILVASWLMFMAAFGMYGRRIDQPSSFFRTLIRINYNFIIFVSVVAFVLRITTTNRILFAIFVVLSNVVVTVTRGMPLFDRAKTFAIVGTDALVCNVLNSAKECFALQNASFAGFVSPSVHYNHFFSDNDLPVLGSMEHSLAKLPHQVDCIVVALPDDFPAKAHLLEDLQETGLRILMAYKVPERIDFVPI